MTCYFHTASLLTGQATYRLEWLIQFVQENQWQVPSLLLDHVKALMGTPSPNLRPVDECVKRIPPFATAGRPSIRTIIITNLVAHLPVLLRTERSPLGKGLVFELDLWVYLLADDLAGNR